MKHLQLQYNHKVAFLTLTPRALRPIDCKKNLKHEASVSVISISSEWFYSKRSIYVPLVPVLLSNWFLRESPLLTSYRFISTVTSSSRTMLLIVGSTYKNLFGSAPTFPNRMECQTSHAIYLVYIALLWCHCIVLFI